MAGSSLLTLIDDIATLLDDVSLMTKVAAKKTAGVLGDDLALNAQQLTGLQADRELPVVWAVARGSLLNKLLLIPAALAISALLPWAIALLLMLGGAFLCYEGVEKLAHKLLHAQEAEQEHRRRLAAVADAAVDMRAFEAQRIKGAVRTDFILSAEIIVITLGTVAGEPLGVQVAVLLGIGLLITVGVYGLVAAIVKIDDLGLYLSRREGSMAALGRSLLAGAPYLMKGLSVVGTLAMFLVGGGILTHGIPALHHLVRGVAEARLDIPGLEAVVHGLGPSLFNMLVGLLVGTLVLGAVSLGRRLWARGDG